MVSSNGLQRKLVLTHLLACLLTHRDYWQQLRVKASTQYHRAESLTGLLKVSARLPEYLTAFCLPRAVLVGNSGYVSLSKQNSVSSPRAACNSQTMAGPSRFGAPQADPGASI